MHSYSNVVKTTTFCAHNIKWFHISLQKNYVKKIILKLLSLAFATTGLGQKNLTSNYYHTKAIKKIPTQSSGSCVCGCRPVAHSLAFRACWGWPLSGRPARWARSSDQGMCSCSASSQLAPSSRNLCPSRRATEHLAVPWLAASSHVAGWRNLETQNNHRGNELSQNSLN